MIRVKPKKVKTSSIYTSYGNNTGMKTIKGLTKKDYNKLKKLKKILSSKI